MKNTIKSLIFIASMFIFLGLFVAFGRFVLQLPAYYTTGGGLLAYLIALGVQGILKNTYIVPRVRSHGVLMSVKVQTIKLKDRVTASVLPFFAIFSSWFYTKPTIDNLLPTLILFGIFLLCLEILLRFGESTMRMHFTSKGVAISGYDFRPEMTLPFAADNLPGIYEYDQIAHFSATEDQIRLTQFFDSNNLIVPGDEELLRKIVGLLLSRNILPEKNHE